MNSSYFHSTSSHHAAVVSHVIHTYLRRDSFRVSKILKIFSKMSELLGAVQAFRTFPFHLYGVCTALEFEKRKNYVVFSVMYCWIAAQFTSPVCIHLYQSTGERYFVSVKKMRMCTFFVVNISSIMVVRLDVKTVKFPVFFLYAPHIRCRLKLGV